MTIWRSLGLLVVCGAALALVACSDTDEGAGGTPLAAEKKRAEAEAALNDFRASLVVTEEALDDFHALPSTGRSVRRQRKAVASARKNLDRVWESLGPPLMERPPIIHPIINNETGETVYTQGLNDEVKRHKDDAFRKMLAAVDAALAAVDAALARVGRGAGAGGTQPVREPLRKELYKARRALNKVKGYWAEGGPKILMLHQAERTLSAASDSLVPLRLLVHVGYSGECDEPVVVNEPLSFDVDFLCAVEGVKDRLNQLLDPMIIAIQDEMSEMGFRVFDETRITFHNRPRSFSAPGDLSANARRQAFSEVDELMEDSYLRTRRTTEQILKMCRLADQSLDIAAIFTIRPAIRRTQAGTNVSGKINGQMLNCQDSSRLGGASEQDFNKLTSSDPRIRPTEIIKALVKQADIGRQVASALANKLPGRRDASSPVVNDSRGGNRLR